MLVLYDLIILLASDFILLVVYHGAGQLSRPDLAWHVVSFAFCVFAVRYLGTVYHQVWRYGGIQCFIKLILADFFAFLLYLLINCFSPITRIAFPQLLSICCVNLLGALAMRMFYRYAYKCHDESSPKGVVLSVLLRVFAGKHTEKESNTEGMKIKVAIVGAGRIGVNFAEELLNNRMASYTPCCFIDIDKEKVGKVIHEIPVLAGEEATAANLNKYGIQEVIFAVSQVDAEKKKRLYDYYRSLGYKIKVYDYPTVYVAGGKRHLREFEVEDLLFRKPIDCGDENVAEFYEGKRVLITGGGGSIGSELCRQIARMKPEQLIILDIYENSAYDLQQELKIAYGSELDFHVEIVSIANKKGLARVFEEYHPQIVINAAAHKHVPLMEKNVVEAVENNVFGTLNVVQLCEEYHAERFMMVSTDKAVNPTNVMGATKRVCEMIVQAYSTLGNVTYSCTRFGNVLGSAGSVIPLFKKQIANGGPVTLTDKRIVRYFMTIPEAARLVLTSGSMAKNGELFVLDMGEPVKILDLAENMIQLSGARDIEIVETGLRPGEKLYEELLVKTEKMEKTDNDMIFIERDRPMPLEDMLRRVGYLQRACSIGKDEVVKETLRGVVPSYRTPEEVNARAIAAAEYKVDTDDHTGGDEKVAVPGNAGVIM
jgi:FlaA1/EpsC-like NDP-sugar epimerase